MLETKGFNGHDGNQRAQWSRWKPKGTMVTMETKGPNGHDANQRAQWSLWKPKGPIFTMETIWPNGHDGLMFLINLVPKKLCFFHGLFI